MDFARAKLSSICDSVDYGYTASASQDPIGPRFLRITDIVPEQIDWERVPYCAVDARKLAKFRLQTGDIVVARTGATTGWAKFIKDPPDSVFASYLVRLRPSREVDSRYVGFVVQSSVYKEFVQQHMGGAAQPNANAQVLSSFELPLPPLPIQRRIAGILSAYDDLIENCQRRIKILESMARALYREWFVHFRFPGHEGHRFVDSPLGKIPEGWEAQSFSALLGSMKGGDWGSAEPDDKQSFRVAVVRGTDFDAVAYGGQQRVPIRYIKTSSFESRSLQAGDVIVENSVNAKTRCVGTPLFVDARLLARLETDAIAASFCKVLRFHDPRLAPLTVLHLRYLRDTGQMDYYQNTAANGIGNFQAKKFAAEEHLTLPKDAADRLELSGAVADVLDSISLLASQVDNLRTTRDLLLPRLLSGKIELDVA